MKLLDSFQKTSQIIDQMATFTSPKLSLNQETIIKTSFLQINLKKNKINDLNGNFQINNAEIEAPSLCASISNDCSNLIATSQVSK